MRVILVNGDAEQLETLLKTTRQMASDSDGSRPARVQVPARSITVGLRA